MRVPEIVYPGAFRERQDPASDSQVEILLLLLRTQLSDLAIAVELFEEDIPQISRRAGLWPREFIWRVPFLHAHSFLIGLDLFGKLLKKLSDEPEAPTDVPTLVRRFEERFPDVARMRDSALHLEDRGRGYVRDRPLSAAAGLIFLGNLTEDRLDYTLADGRKVELSISWANVEFVRDLFQAVVNSFSWTGRSHSWPSLDGNTVLPG